jgi:hypothetical protein
MALDKHQIIYIYIYSIKEKDGFFNDGVKTSIDIVVNELSCVSTFADPSYRLLRSGRIGAFPFVVVF